MQCCSICPSDNPASMKNPDSGHDHISEEKIDGGLRVFDQLDGFFATLGLDDFVAIGF